MASSSSSSFFGIEPLDGGGESETCRHAMDACSLCGKHLAGDCDIFMYRFVFVPPGRGPDCFVHSSSFTDACNAERCSDTIVPVACEQQRGHAVL